MTEVSLYILVGAVTGLLAGLFGIGGGVIIVPGLVYTFNHVGIDQLVLMHMAESTSLAVIILTTLVAVLAQHRKGNILWNVFYRLVPGIVLGSVMGSLIASVLSSHVLRIIFGFFVIVTAIRMLIPTQLKELHEHPHKWPIQLGAGLAIGGLSGMLGIGGGVFTVPVLLYFGLPVHNATATSSACALLLGCVGTIAFMVTGWGISGLPVGSTGYVYWPAVLGVAFASMIFVPLGIKFAQHLSSAMLKRIFAVILILVGIDMLLGLGTK